MILKKRFPALENMLNVAGSVDFESIFPKEFLVELEEFIRRNSVVKIKGECGLYVDHCCDKCLKAYAIKKAKSINLGRKGMEILEKIEKECGHDGYYLDGKELRIV
jgi:hypothetical protein